MAFESNDRRVREVHETMYVQFNIINIMNNNSAVPIFIWARLVSSLVSDAPKVRKRRVRIFLLIRLVTIRFHALGFNQ